MKPVYPSSSRFDTVLPYFDRQIALFADRCFVEIAIQAYHLPDRFIVTVYLCSYLHLFLYRFVPFVAALNHSLSDPSFLSVFWLPFCY